MKKTMIFLVLGVMLLQFSNCTKDEKVPLSDTGKKDLRIVEGAPCLTCQEPINYIPNNWTDAELLTMGLDVGCALRRESSGVYGAKVMKIKPGTTSDPMIDPVTGDVIYEYRYSDIYTIYYRTINNPAFPELYREGVREGWLACNNNQGTITNQCGKDVVVSTKNVNINNPDGYMMFEVKKYCDWLLR